MLISENVPSVHETHLYKSRTDLSQSKNQHQRCAANSFEIVKGPQQVRTSGCRRALLATDDCILANKSKIFSFL